MNRLSRRRVFGLTLVLVLLWLLAAALALNAGSVSIPSKEIFGMIGNRIAGREAGDARQAAILFSVRLPRVLLGSLVGAALAASGTAFQSLLRNPLADPYVLGVSTGASLGTILYAMFASSAVPTVDGALIFARPIAAFLGATLTVAIVYVIAGGAPGARQSSQRLLLAGIVLASFISSVNVFLLTSTNQADLRGIFYWLIGDLSRPVDASIYVVAAAVMAGFALLYLLSHSLNLISMGEEDALILGVAVRPVKIGVYTVASLMTGAVVSISGPIAYVGLICPHIARMLFGSDNRILFPTVFLFGAIFTMLADTVARTVLAPTELPVGVITAICGAPLFIFLLYRRSNAP